MPCTKYPVFTERYGQVKNDSYRRKVVFGLRAGPERLAQRRRRQAKRVRRAERDGDNKAVPEQDERGCTMDETSLSVRR